MSRVTLKGNAVRYVKPRTVWITGRHGQRELKPQRVVLIGENGKSFIGDNDRRYRRHMVKLHTTYDEALAEYINTATRRVVFWQEQLVKAMCSRAQAEADLAEILAERTVNARRKA